MSFGTPNPNIVPWLDFFLSVVYKQSKLAVELLSKENIEKLLSPKQIAVWEYLQTVDEAPPKDISQNAKVALPTVAQALGKLIQLKSRAHQETDVLLTHGLAHGYLDIGQPQDGHLGSKTLADRIGKLKIPYIIHGHIHGSYGMKKTKRYNLYQLLRVKRKL